ncbi:MAG TPA: tetratricopeptide repeat protein [Roseiflexaceae bacterium]|nr:tetratricopeptide repeat protein [Roseiflexaceae bacterium]
MRWPITSLVRKLAPAIQLFMVLLALWQSARIVFRPDRLDDLRHADALFAAGRYHDARAAYAAVLMRAPRLATAVLRLGIVYAVRNERAAADEQLAYALSVGLGQGDYDLARLYQGWLAAEAGQHEQAARYWATIGERSAWLPVRHVLQAESLLALGDYAGAEAAYRDATPADLPPEWHGLASLRLALLRASSDPAAALAELQRAPALAASEPSGAVYGAPLVPAAETDARLLAAALRAPPEQRHLLLGQLYLRARLYGLAEAQFAAVAPGSPSAIAAAAYAAYTRWSAGDRPEGLRRLEALVAAHPSERRARGLLALAYLSSRDPAGAQTQLAIVRAQAPRAPETHLAWAQWYVVQHDYVAAAAEYRRAHDDAAPEQRGPYALALARFHLDIALDRCETGLPAAEEAARILLNDPRAWTTLASARFGCGDPAGARAAAEQALQHDPASAEASYYLGRALAALGDRPAARLALISAADLAPRSAWRERAESQIATLGL